MLHIQNFHFVHKSILLVQIHLVANIIREIVIDFFFLYVPEKKYTVIVHTGNVRYAGTDANVFVNLIGSKATAKGIHLKNSTKHKYPFQNGQ